MSRINEVVVFSIKISLYFIEKKPIKFIKAIFLCNHTKSCHCVNLVSVTSASRYITSPSRYHPRCQSRSSIYIRGLITRNSAESVEVVPIAIICVSVDRGLQRPSVSEYDQEIPQSDTTDQPIFCACLYYPE